VAGVVPGARMVVVGADGTRREVLLTGEGPPGLALVQGLARFQFLARRAGGRVWLEDVSPALGELLDLAGLRRELAGQAGLSGQAAVIARAAAVSRGDRTLPGGRPALGGCPRPADPLTPEAPLTPEDPVTPGDPAPGDPSSPETSPAG
jgi:hypothetical protein